MKKIITMLSLVVISIMFIVGCSDSKKSNELYIGNCPDNMMIGMGKKYFINNLEEGNYEIEFTAKEYDYGVLKEEHVLYKSTIEDSRKIRARKWSKFTNTKRTASRSFFIRRAGRFGQSHPVGIDVSRLF